MMKISFFEFLIAVTVIWVVVRSIVSAKNNRFDFKYECKLLLVYFCLVVVGRFVYFPYHLTDGHIGYLCFDIDYILPFRINLIPIINYVKWFPSWTKFNIFGNISLFIPVGIIFPFCINELDSIKKTVLTGFLMSVIIELSQLLLYERFTDIDDVITNTSGVFIGACLYFFIVKRILERIKQKSE